MFYIWWVIFIVGVVAWSIKDQREFNKVVKEMVKDSEKDD